MSESLPKCKICSHDAFGWESDDSQQWVHCSNAACRMSALDIYPEQWRTLHDQSRCAELEAKLARLPADWETDSSLETWFPYTAERIAELEEELARARYSYDEGVIRDAEEIDRLKAENAAQRDRLAKIDALLATDSIESFNLLSDAQKAEWFVVTGQRDREQKAENAALREAPKLIVGQVYETSSHGLVTYLGLDHYMGETTHKFSSQYGSAYWRPDALQFHDIRVPTAPHQPAQSEGE